MSNEYTKEQQEKMSERLIAATYSVFAIVIEEADKLGIDRDIALFNFISGCVQTFEQCKPFDKWKSWDEFTTYCKYD